MNYPVWWIPTVSGALQSALASALFACCVQLFAGGTLFLLLAKRRAERERADGLLQDVRAYAVFLTRAGAAAVSFTGAGLWFVVSVVSPGIAATLNGVFALLWGSAWLCFLIGFLALRLWSETLGSTGQGRRRGLAVVALLFTAAAAGLLSVATSFMLAPGDWPHSGEFSAAIFAPALWPVMTLRFFLSLTLAGLLACVLGARVRDTARQTRILCYACGYVFWPVAGLAAGVVWLFAILPAPQLALLLTASRETTPLLSLFVIVSSLVALGGPALAFVAPQHNRPALACFLLLLGLAQTGLFERILAAGRSPWAIPGHTWSNALLAADLDTLRQGGALPRTRWIPPGATNRDAGRALFAAQCLPCHSIGGPLRDILPRTANLTLRGMEAKLSGQGRLREPMPPFAGEAADREALAAYIMEELHGRPTPAPTMPAVLPQQPAEPPAFDPANAAYVLLAWTDAGMSLVSDADRFFSLSPPGVTLRAQLIRRGPRPELITAGVTIHYALDPAFSKPSRQVRFWEFVIPLFIDNRLPDQGLSGNFPSGTMQPLVRQDCFVATLLPVIPYPDSGGFDPYPLVTVEARDERSGALLAETRAVVPASTELGCGNCHGGATRASGAHTPPGMDEQAARNILSAHDRRHGTKLLKNALWRHPKACQQCHEDASLPPAIARTQGGDRRLNLSAALHGVHALYLGGRGAEACAECHASALDGLTRSLRGVHGVKGLDCTRCHGTLENHALGLLRAEDQTGKTRAQWLMQPLTQGTAPAREAVRPRSAWRMQPDCAACHDGPSKPTAASTAVNAWTDGQPDSLYSARRDPADALYCAACHNSAHAEYPAVNPYGKNRDNLQPLQYQNLTAPLGANGNCCLCHVTAPPPSPHHHRSNARP